MHHVWTIVLSVGLACAAIGCTEALSQDQGPAVASVQGDAIGQEAFRHQYVDYLLSVGLQDTPTLRFHFLDILIADKLLAHEAHEAGRVDADAYHAEEARTRRKLLLDAYAQHVLYDTLQVDERDVAEAFVRANTQLTVRHLYAPTQDEARVLQARLQAGETFEALAREVFSDTTLANNGGLIGTVSFDELDPAFEEVAYSLEPGAISEPVKTAYGYSIIRVDERFAKPILTQTEYAQKRDKLARFVQRREQQRVRAEHARALGERINPVFNPDALATLLGQITGQSVIAGEEAFQTWLVQPLVTFGASGERQTWSVETFRQQAQYTDPRQRAQVRTQADLEQFITGLLVRETLLAEARSLGLDQRPDYRAAVQQALEDWIVQRERQRLRAEATVPADSVQAHYEAHRAQYQMPPRRHVREILTATRAEAEALKAQLDAGASFEALARAHTLRPGAHQSGGDLGWVTREQLGAVGARVFEAAPGTVLGPIALGTHYVLLQAGAREAARPMTLSEARPEIEESVRLMVGRLHLEAHLDSLRAAYDGEILINRDLVAAMQLPPSRKASS